MEAAALVVQRLLSGRSDASLAGAQRQEVSSGQWGHIFVQLHHDAADRLPGDLDVEIRQGVVDAAAGGLASNPRLQRNKRAGSRLP